MKHHKNLAVIIALIMSFALTACSCTCEDNSNFEPEKHIPAGFVEIATYRVETTYSWVYQYTFYDPETMVMYTFIDEGDGGAMTVLYNTDGTVRIYTPNIEAEE